MYIIVDKNKLFGYNEIKNGQILEARKGDLPFPVYGDVVGYGLVCNIIGYPVSWVKVCPDHLEENVYGDYPAFASNKMQIMEELPLPKWYLKGADNVVAIMEDFIYSYLKYLLDHAYDISDGKLLSWFLDGPSNEEMVEISGRIARIFDHDKSDENFVRSNGGYQRCNNVEALLYSVHKFLYYKRNKGNKLYFNPKKDAKYEYINDVNQTIRGIRNDYMIYEFGKAIQKNK